MATPARQAHSAQHQQPPQTPVVDADVILEHKENIKPLASGRRAAALADVFTPKSKENRSARLATDKKKHTKECDDALDNDDDPLAAFVRFVDWTIDNYPQGECVESGLLELLEFATRTFADSPLYKNDMRYLKLWILYASIVDHPAKIYAYLNTNEIGSGYSLFYEEYCNALERGGQHREAAEMYDIGIARRAHPLQRLQARRRDFNIRMMSAPAQVPDAPPLPSQPALGGQSSGRLGFRDNGDPFALPSTSTPQQRSGNNRTAFQVYTGEGGTQAPGNSWPELESRDSHRKENHRSAVSAQGETLKQRITVPSVPKLDVYVDEGVDAAPKTPGKTPSKELAAKGSKIEALKRDPLRNFQQQPLAPPPVPAAANLLGSSNSKLPPATKLFPSTSPAKNKVTSLPAVKANELLEIDLSLYTVADGTEVNPAEQRTTRMGLSNKVWPAPPAHLLLAAPTLSASSNQDTSGDLSTGNVSGRAGRHREMTASINFSGESTSHTSNTRRSRPSLTTNRDPTVTINTKEGLMDVYGFFNSPTKSMKLEGIEESVRKPPKTALKLVDFSENAGVPPTPTPGTFRVGGENAMSMQKGVFKPFSENETPGPKRSSDPMRTPGLAFQPPPSAGASKTPGTAKRGLAIKPVTPAVEPAPAPVLESQETDEDEYDDALPDPETPFARKKPAVGFVPFSDIASVPAPKVLQIFEDTSSTPAPAPKGVPIVEVAAEPEDKRPVHEEDLFPVQDIQNRPGAFRPFQDRNSLGAGDEDGGEEMHDDQQEEEEYWSESQEEPYDDQTAADGEEDGEQQPAAGGRWAPALTPITERTYEPTSTFSNRWTTPLEQRDQSVADTGTFTFDSAEAARAATRLAEELRVEEEEETRDLQRMRFAEMYRRESIGLRQSLGGSEGFAGWTEDGESRAGSHSVREDGVSEGDEEGEMESSRSEIPVVDPYTTQTLSEILAQLEVPPTHRDLRPAVANQLDKLQKCFKARGRTSGNTPRGSNRSTVGQDEVFDLDLDGDRYDILSKLGEGGFGAVFLATDVAAFQRLEDEGEDSETLSKVAVKVVKPAMVWESYALDLIHQNVDPFVLPSIIKPHTLYIYGDESYLVLDYSNRGTLLEAVNRASDIGIGHGLNGMPTTIPGMDESLAMFFAVELLRTVEGLHRAGFIHGDLKIDNCMVRLEPSPPSGLDPHYDPSGAGGWSTKGIRLIDFGRTIDTNLFPLGQQFTTDWKVDKRDCLEMRQKHPWTYETDYYGLVGIVYCLLFGKYMEMPVLKEDADGRVIQKLPATLRRYWRVDIWEAFFDMLLNPHQFGTELPIADELFSMRRIMEAWLVDNSAKNTRKLSLAVLIKRLTMAHV